MSTVYKLCMTNPFDGAYNNPYSDRWFYSSFAGGPFRLTYRLNKYTIPVYGKIFAFDSRDSLKKYITDKSRGYFQLNEKGVSTFSTTYALFECESTTIETPNSTDIIPTREDDFKSYWSRSMDERYHQYGPGITIPEGTVYCYDLMLSKVLDVNDVKGE